jgi:hypothetical protein
MNYFNSRLGEKLSIQIIIMNSTLLQQPLQNIINIFYYNFSSMVFKYIFINYFCFLPIKATMLLNIRISHSYIYIYRIFSLKFN